MMAFDHHMWQPLGKMYSAASYIGCSLGAKMPYSGQNQWRGRKSWFWLIGVAVRLALGGKRKSQFHGLILPIPNWGG